MAIQILLIGIIICITLYVIYKLWKINNYWDERGVPNVKQGFLFGDTYSLLKMKMNSGDLLSEVFNKFPNEPYIGIIQIMKPVLLFKDVELIELILIKDFMHFTDHGFEVDFKEMPFDSNLFLMGGKHWKALRNKLSPIFTTGKLKMMFDSMKHCGDNLVSKLDSTNNQGIEMKDLISRFTMDVIGSCAFGIEAETLVNPDNEYYRMARKAFHMDLLQIFKLILVTVFTPIALFFKISFNKNDVKKYFCQVISHTLKYRRQNGYLRNDFVQLMMQLQDKGYVEMQTKDSADDYLNIEPTYTTWKFEMSDEEITGHAFTFLTAGFETTQVTLIYALYELSKQPEVQQLARDEILREVNDSKNMTYDAIKSMVYLERCIKETLRKYPAAQVLMRRCTADYTLPNGFVIEKGQNIVIPMKTVHYDPEYYPEPEIFRPERFNPDQTLPNCAYIPFGNGPRICIAMRFAMLEMKYCLAKLLMNYSFELSDKTKEPLTTNIRSLFGEPNEKIIFNITKIKS